jgi:hypothetical protein
MDLRKTPNQRFWGTMALSVLQKQISIDSIPSSKGEVEVEV